MMLETADRGYRADAISDVVQLDQQYPLHTAALEQRVPDTNDLCGLAIQNHAVDLLREARMMIRIAVPECAAPLTGENRGIVALIRLATAGAFVVDQDGVGGKHAKQASAPDFETIIEIVVDDLMSLVEPTDPVEDFAPGQQTGTRDRSHIALSQSQAEIAGIVSLLVAKDVATHPQIREEHTRMLNSRIRIEQLSPDHTDFRPLRVLDHRPQPARLDDLDIVVQEQQTIPISRRRASVVEARPVKR